MCFQTVDTDDPPLGALDKGERSVITLGLSLKAALILIDERKGAAIALSKGFEVVGTLGVLDLAAVRGVVDLADPLTVLSGRILVIGRNCWMRC
jgi:predicted nucleic acid-binding protein